VSDMDIVQSKMIGAIQRILVRLDARSQLTLKTRTGSAARSAGAGNVRSRPATTDGLPSTA